MNNYLFITLDRYDSANSHVVEFRSKMQSLQAFRFAYLGNVSEEEDYYEEEIAFNVKLKNNLATYDGEEYSYILIKL